MGRSKERIRGYFSEAEPAKEHKGYFCSAGKALALLLPAYMLVKDDKARPAESASHKMGAAAHCGRGKGFTLSFDGKTIRSTGKTDGYDSPLRITSVRLEGPGITVGQRDAAGEGNEIPAAASDGFPAKRSGRNRLVLGL
jgi:hypothetical protein